MSLAVEVSGEGGNCVEWTDVQLERLGCNIRTMGCSIACGAVVWYSAATLSPYFLSLAAVIAFLGKCEFDYAQELIDFDNPKELNEVRAKILKTPLDQIIYKYNRYFDLRIMPRSAWCNKFYSDTEGLNFSHLYDKYQWADISELFPKDERTRFEAVWKQATPVIETYKSRKTNLEKSYERRKTAIIDRYTYTEPRYYYTNGQINVYYVSVTDWDRAQPNLIKLAQMKEKELEILWGESRPQYQAFERTYQTFLRSITYNQSKVK